jgi:hypothetical protein
VTIEVEKAEYETAVAWLRDLIYGSEFNQERCVFLLIEGVSDIIQSNQACKSSSLKSSKVCLRGSEMEKCVIFSLV